MNNDQIKILLSAYKQNEVQFKAAMSQLREQITKVPADKQSVFNQGIGKLEAIMREVEFPTMKSLSGKTDIVALNNRILSKLGEVQDQFNKIKETCLL